MINTLIMFLIIFLIIFTPIAFGAMELWAFSLMELGILLIIILWAIQTGIVRLRASEKSLNSPIYNPCLSGRQAQSAIPMVLLSLFLLLILFQMISLPSGVLKIISPKTFSLRQSLSISNFELSALSFEPSVSGFPLSFFPFLTQI